MSTGQYPFGQARVKRKQLKASSQSTGWLPAFGVALLLAVVVGLVALQGRFDSAETAETSSSEPSSGSASPQAPEVANGRGNGDTTRFEVAALYSLDQLQISERTTRSGYSRDRFPTWLDLDGNGCRARDDVLAAQSQVPVVKQGACKVVSGSWFSAYDGVTTTDPQRISIDHMVPLANAWRSGAAEWEANRRAAFANDTSASGELFAVTTEINNRKGDAAPESWRPPNRASWCGYARAWVNVKGKWGLSATTAERDALGQMLDTCI